MQDVADGCEHHIDDGHGDGDAQICRIADGVGRKPVFLAQLDEFAANFVEPVVKVKRAGKDRLEDDCTAVRRLWFSGKRVDFFGQFVHPVESV